MVLWRQPVGSLEALASRFDYAVVMRSRTLWPRSPASPAVPHRRVEPKFRLVMVVDRLDGAGPSPAHRHSRPMPLPVAPPRALTRGGVHENLGNVRGLSEEG